MHVCVYVCVLPQLKFLRFRQSDTVYGNVFAEQNDPLTRLMMHVENEQYNTSYTLHRISGIFQV